MTFEDARFDAVYASHALEHAFDASLVTAELARVGRPGAVVGVEVPLGPASNSADRIEFNDLDDLRTVVAPIVAEELWTDVQPAGTPTNEQGTPVARIVFRLGRSP
jgi:ubiquinone/menaquinone biosynthesis C-methylase UbiE